LLQQYTYASVAWRELPELEAAQHLTALSFLDPSQAEQWLAGSGPGAHANLDSEWYVAMRRRIEDQSMDAAHDVATRLVAILGSRALSGFVAGVETLALAGLAADEADAVVDRLLDIETGPERLTRLLVLDDTSQLVRRGPVYQRIEASKRVQAILCVAVGPMAGNDRRLRLPWSLGGFQGHGVLWAGDSRGIDWRMTPGAVAKSHAIGGTTGLDLLVKLLSVDVVFDWVRQRLDHVSGHVACPGLRLVPAGDEARLFSAALASAIHVETGAGTGFEGPFASLLPDAAGGTSLDPGGQLATYRDEVIRHVAESARALSAMGALGSPFGGGNASFRTAVIDVHDALARLRDLAIRLLSEASTTGELATSQQWLLAGAGVRLAAAPAPWGSGRYAEAEESAVYRAVAAAIRGGDLPGLVSRRLAATAREARRQGSASYLPQVDRVCPAELLTRLGSPPERLSRRSRARISEELGLRDAEQAARALTDLVVSVGNREWSPATPSPGELSRTGIALSGARKALAEHADATSFLGNALGPRLKPLTDSLLPLLRDLVLSVAAAEIAAPSARDQEAFAVAEEKTGMQLVEWTRQVTTHGVSATPSFASSAVHSVRPPGDEEVAAAREAMLYPATGEMWQLCRAADLPALEEESPPLALRIAPRIDRDALLGGLAGAETQWTSLPWAGLLRLVPLRPGIVDQSWGESEMIGDAAGEGHE
jgi:hypothetical protein